MMTAYVKMITRIIAMVLLVTAAAQAEEAAAPANPPKSRLYLADLTIVRYNPLGIETQNRLMYSHRLMDSSSMLFRDTFLAAGPSLKLNPAYLKVGPVIDFQPIALFNLRLAYEYVYYFGTFAYLQSYPKGDLDYSDDRRDDTKDSAYNTGGHHLFAEPMVQAKVWKIVARSKFALEYWDIDIHDNDKYFYDATLDTLVPVKKLIWTNDTDVIFMDGRLVAGLRYTAVFPGTESSHHRLGPIVAWSFHTRDYTSFNKPTLLAIFGWYLDHPNREGALPYMLLGFSFTSDLWNSN